MAHKAYMATRKRTIGGFVKLNKEDVINIYRLML